MRRAKSIRVLSLILGALLLGAPMAARAQETPAVAIPRSHRLTIDSDILGRSYELRIQLPPSYDRPEAAGRRYPVLYLNDGPYNFQVAVGVTHLPMNAGNLEEMIIVGIGYAEGESGDDSRIRDYTPTSNPAWERTTGGAGPYLELIERETIPLIEATYRADPQRRVLAGHSLGGLFGAYVLLTKPELFDAYILSSPSFWFHENVIWELEEAYAAAHTDLPAKVYVAIGGMEHPARPPSPTYRGSPYEMVDDVLTFERRLAGRGYPSLELRTKVVDGLNHETVFPSNLLFGLLWRFGGPEGAPFGY